MIDGWKIYRTYGNPSMSYADKAHWNEIVRSVISDQYPFGDD